MPGARLASPRLASPYQSLPVFFTFAGGARFQKWVSSNNWILNDLSSSELIVEVLVLSWYGTATETFGSARFSSQSPVAHDEFLRLCSNLLGVVFVRVRA